MLIYYVNFLEKLDYISKKWYNINGYYFFIERGENLKQNCFKVSMDITVSDRTEDKIGFKHILTSFGDILFRTSDEKKEDDLEKEVQKVLKVEAEIGATKAIERLEKYTERRIERRKKAKLTDSISIESDINTSNGEKEKIAEIKSEEIEK